MYRQIVINAAEHETRLALIEDVNIVELYIERGDISDIAGNIYKGRVQRVLPGMHAAFVDIGLKQAAFLYVNDVKEDNYKEIEKLFSSKNGLDDESSPTESDEIIIFHENRDLHIEEMITEGQDIMVLVNKAPIGSKGARVTTHMSLPGRFLVLMPTSDHIGISRRIEDEKERNRLKGIVESLRKNDFGYIVRTAAEGIQKEKLEYEKR